MASAASCYHYGRKLTGGDSYQSVCLVAQKEYGAGTQLAIEFIAN